MAKKFTELRAKMSLASQSRAAARTECMMVEMQLAELRQSRSMTQTSVAETMGVAQAAVSKFEHREDVYLSTLREYIAALGGELKLTAVFPDTEVQVHSYHS